MKKATLMVGIFAALALFVGVLGIGDAITIMGDKAAVLEESKIGSLSVGDLAKGEIDGALDEIAVQKTTRSYGFIPMGSSETPYYLVHINDHYAVVSAGNKDVQKKINDLADRTWDFFDEKRDSIGEGVKVEGKLIAMPEKVEGYLKDYCKELDFDDSEYAELVENGYVINVVQYDSMKIVPFAAFGIAAVLIIVLVILIVKGKKNSL